jgi:hypothetical protein
MPNEPFPPLPEGWSVSSLGPHVDHFRIDDRHQGKLYEGTQAQCSEFITWHTQPEQTQHAMGDQRDLVQVRDGYTGRVLAGFRTIDAANELAWSIENGAPYAGVPANALAVEFWQRQPDGQYQKMSMGQVERELEVGQAIEQRREQLAPHERYRQLLEEISDLRYPGADAALRRKIESSIDKKVGEFMAECGELPKHARAREQQQQIQPPPAMRAQQQRGMDRGGYEQ